MRTGILMGLLLTIAPNTLGAQLPIPIILEGRLGVAIPQGEVADSGDGLGATSGLNFAAAARIEPTAGVGIFVAYEQARFGCDDCRVVGLDDRATVEAIGAGVRYTMAVTELGFSPWVEASLVQQTLGLSDEGQDITSDAALGFTAGVGATVPLVGGLQVEPGLRYLSTPAEFDFAALPDRDVDVAAFTLAVALSLRI